MFAEFVEMTWVSLHREAYRLCHDWHEAEDLVQLTLHRIYDRWSSLRDRHELRSYSRRALLHVFVSERRRARWRHEVTTVDLPERAASTGVAEDRLTLLTAIATLPDRQRMVILLRFWHDLTAEQTAQVLDCPRGTVTSQTHRALSSLRDSLGVAEHH
jgi:RNA polymerase sigma-70 factor (sigma-E family)